MDTTQETTGQAPETGKMKRARLVRLGLKLLPIFGALLLSGGMLAAWFTGMAWASSIDQENFPEILQAAASYTIIKSTNFSTFSIGPASQTGNQYIITVKSSTVTSTAQLKVTDLLPTGITISDTKGTAEWNCGTVIKPTELSCTFTGNNPTNKPIFINVNVAANVAAQVNNTATLFVDGSPGPESTITTIIDTVDLRIKKSINRQFADVNDIVVYTINYHNAGPAIATDLKIIDAIPTSLKIIDVLPTPSLITSSSTISYFNWTSLTFNPGITNTILMTATPTSSASGRLITNNVSISSKNSSEWNNANNTASASFSVSGINIVKTKPAAIDYIKVGEPFTYTIRVENNGSSSASGVVISDVFDPGLSVTGAKLTVGTTVTRFSSGNNLSKSIGTLPAGGVALLDVGVRGNSTVTQPITVTNMATVRASPSIVRTSNITDTGVVTITPAADFYVLNTDGVTSVTPGQLVTYTVTIQNIGSAITHTNFLVTDTLAAYLDFSSLNLGTLVYTPTFISSDNRVHVWRIGEKLDPNEAISYKITGKVQSNAPVGNYTNHRVVARSPDEKYLGNNTAVDQNLITVQPTQNYNFVLKIDRTRVNIGEGIHFGITLSNVGTTIPVNAKVTDIFPAVLDIVEAKTSLGTLTTNASTRTVTVNIGSFSPGQTVEIAISTKVNATATTSAVYEHTSVLTFNPNVTINSNTVEFSVLTGTGVLPGTGIGPPTPAHYSRVSPAVLLLLPFVLLLPLVILGRRWSSSPQP